MEEFVKDTMLSGKSDDPVFIILLELAYKYIRGERVFANELEAPAFFVRYFVRWVKEGMEEVRKAEAAEGVPPALPA